MRTIVEIEATKGKQINYDNIKRIMYTLNERYGNDITVKFAADWTYTVEVNK
ncbi:hypothetical protein P4159_25405 [Bacillus thuringiensis]|uniref:hypothetical protein n=1 Tax=Bacillus thuringiensis TaxID=1428 RepID=UPI000A8B57C9|nr:hypothetical protein [Bacillus thuringiensis]MEC3596243.1 hypothetical protein [Bacillus thuringiensis]MED1834837.1 hypothetical protein [Bacillus thuringiensis]MED2208061.1 hypothetical protein [Bacillus thuringiensis]MED2666479.1 hypothetical protein [Bacillus thuringiensis]MED2671990.1 hypothetical protein [Bacillus thuringiensis]